MDVYQRRRLVALGGLAAVVVLIGAVVAGGDDDDEPEAPVTTIGATGPGLTSLPKREFIDQADSICAETDAALEGIGTANPTRAARQEAELATAELEQLQTLPPPEKDAETFDVFLAALEEQSRTLADRRLAAERADDAALAEIDAAAATAQADAEAAAEEFGFEVCGDPSATADTEADTGGAAVPAPTAPAPTETVPAPTTPTPSPVTPEGGATPTPTPPADTGDDSGSGGVSP